MYGDIEAHRTKVQGTCSQGMSVFVYERESDVVGDRKKTPPFTDGDGP